MKFKLNLTPIETSCWQFNIINNDGKILMVGEYVGDSFFVVFEDFVADKRLSKIFNYRSFFHFDAFRVLVESIQDITMSKNYTYRELLEVLKELSEDQLDTDVYVYNTDSDQLFRIKKLLLVGEPDIYLSDIFKENRPILVSR